MEFLGKSWKSLDFLWKSWNLLGKVANLAFVRYPVQPLARLPDRRLLDLAHGGARRRIDESGAAGADGADPGARPRLGFARRERRPPRHAARESRAGAPPSRTSGARTEVIVLLDRAQAAQAGASPGLVRDRNPVVLALPRGGAPIGAEIAAALEAPLERRTGAQGRAPGQPELAMGAVVDGEEPIVSATRR